MIISKEDIEIDGIPAIIWGVPSPKMYLYIHGQEGSKEDAYHIAEISKVLKNIKNCKNIKKLKKGSKFGRIYVKI